jgi:hypothetical protein
MGDWVLRDVPPGLNELTNGSATPNEPTHNAPTPNAPTKKRERCLGIENRSILVSTRPALCLFCSLGVELQRGFALSRATSAFRHSPRAPGGCPLRPESGGKALHPAVVVGGCRGVGESALRRLVGAHAGAAVGAAVRPGARSIELAKALLQLGPVAFKLRDKLAAGGFGQRLVGGSAEGSERSCVVPERAPEIVFAGSLGGRGCGSFRRGSQGKRCSRSGR